MTATVPTNLWRNFTRMASIDRYSTSIGQAVAGERGRGVCIGQLWPVEAQLVRSLGDRVLTGGEMGASVSAVVWTCQENVSTSDAAAGDYPTRDSTRKKEMNNEKVPYAKPVVTDLGVQKDFVQATQLGGGPDNVMIGKVFGSTSP